MSEGVFSKPTEVVARLVQMGSTEPLLKPLWPRRACLAIVADACLGTALRGGVARGVCRCAEALVEGRAEGAARAKLEAATGGEGPTKGGEERGIQQTEGGGVEDLQAGLFQPSLRTSIRASAHLAVHEPAQRSTRCWKGGNGSA
jgi:hypothetical protein